MNVLQLGIGFIKTLLPKFSRQGRRAIVRELAADAVMELPDTPRTGRRTRPFGNYWDYLGKSLGSRLVNPDSLSVDQYRMMVDEDETVSAAIEFITLSVVQQFGIYSNTNKRASRFEEELWSRCESSLAGYLREALTATWAGFSVAEKVVEYDEGKLWLSQLPVLDPSGLDFIMEDDRTNRRYGLVRGVAHTGMVLEAPIEAASLAIYSHNSLFGNPFGRSRCKSMFPNWVSKKALFLQWGRTLERYGSPSAYAKSDRLDQPEKHWLTGADTTRSTNILDMIANLHDNGGGALPTDMELILIEAKAALGEDFERAQNHFNKCILRGLLIPALLFEPSDIGSFALGSQHFEIFMASVRQIAEELNRVVLRYIIGPFLRWNFSKRVPLGCYKAQKISAAEVKLWSEIFFSMANRGFIREDLLEDANIVRERLGFPLWEKLPPGRAPVEPSGAGGENLPPDQAPDGRRGVDPGLPHATPQAPSKPQGRAGGVGRKKAA